jgi:site-specific recombinase XerD
MNKNNKPEIREYIRELREKGYAQDSLVSYKTALNKLNLPLTETSIKEFHKKILHLKTNTKTTYLMRLRTYLKKTKPELAKEIIMPKQEKSIPKNIPDKKEAREILQSPDTTRFTGIRDKAILELFYATGIRKNELIELKAEDIDYVKCIIKVRKGKMNKERLVPVSAKALKWVKYYLDRVRPVLKPKSEQLFLNRFGTKLAKNSPYKIVKKYAEYGCHKYRHAYATHLLQNGMKETSLQRLLGHSMISTTQIYTKVTIEELKASYAKHFKRDKWVWK